MAAAVNAVGVSPFLDRFFAVQTNQPHAVTWQSAFAMKLIAQLQQEPGTRTTIVGSDKILYRQHGIVVGSDHKHTIAAAGILGDEVPHGKSSSSGLRRKSVFLNVACSFFQLQSQLSFQACISLP